MATFQEVFNRESHSHTVGEAYMSLMAKIEAYRKIYPDNKLQRIEDKFNDVWCEVLSKEFDDVDFNATDARTFIEKGTEAYRNNMMREKYLPKFSVKA